MTDRLRILVVPKWYPWPGRPVFGVFCREHARALATRHDVIVAASLAVRSPGFRVFCLEDGVEDGLRTLRVLYRRPRLRPLALVCQTLGLLAALRRLRSGGWSPDVVHAHVYQAGLPALALGARARAPVVVTEHYTGLQRGLVTGAERLIARTAYSRAALVAPVSEELAGHVRAIASRARIRVLPNVVDTRLFHPAASRERRGDGDPARLLTVGALAEKKGQRHLLDALALLRSRGVAAELDLVGGGELEGALRAQASRLGVAVRFHGELEKAAVAALMREADLFALPSLFETFGVVLIEAMASGLEVVATAVGGVPEVVGPGAGTLVPPGDAAALADAIAAALARRERPDRDRLAARARERYGYEAFAAAWSAAYAELPSRRGSSSCSTVATSDSSR